MSPSDTISIGFGGDLPGHVAFQAHNISLFKGDFVVVLLAFGIVGVMTSSCVVNQSWDVSFRVVNNSCNILFLTFPFPVINIHRGRSHL